MIAAVIGKGGVGKTTIASLLLRLLIERGETPVLAVDADPSNCLGPALGIPVAATLADMRETMREPSGNRSSMAASERLALGVEEAIVECRGFDLLTMGRPEGKGCYCYVNNLIRDHLDRLGRRYRHVLLDCEAGLEHLSRRTGGRPDVLVCVANRARMAAETVRRALDLFTVLHGSLPPAVHLVLNGFLEGDPLAAQTLSVAGGDGTPFTRVFFIPQDPSVADREATGKALLEIDPESPAVKALRTWEPGV
jgi:CO dehydrogenase maturation factor